MNHSTRQLLLDLNRQFYATVADDFDVTRLNVPMGMVRVLNYVRPLVKDGGMGGWGDGGKLFSPSPHPPIPPLTALDAGCGNGRFCWALEQLETAVAYLGIDADDQLLAHASEHTKSLQHVRAEFSKINLAEPTIPHSAFRTPHFDLVTCFAVLHHMPGYELRLQIVRWLASLLQPQGVMLLSTWQFFNSPRLVAKQLEWSSVGVDANEIEAGDALLPWNQGNYAIRYAHQIDEDELRQLAKDADLLVKEIYYADGKEGNLNLYGVLGKV